MNEDQDWGPWIEHDGEPHPELNGCTAWVCCENGRQETGVIHAADVPPVGCHSVWVWQSMPAWRLETGDRIIRYRLRRPEALRELIRIAADPQPLPDLVPA